MPSGWLPVVAYRFFTQPSNVNFEHLLCRELQKKKTGRILTLKKITGQGQGRDGGGSREQVCLNNHTGATNAPTLAVWIEGLQKGVC